MLTDSARRRRERPSSASSSAADRWATPRTRIARTTPSPVDALRGRGGLEHRSRQRPLHNGAERPAEVTARGRPPGVAGRPRGGQAGSRAPDGETVALFRPLGSFCGLHLHGGQGVVADNRRGVVVRCDDEHTGRFGRVGGAGMFLEPLVEGGLATGEVVELVMTRERLRKPIRHWVT